MNRRRSLRIVRCLLLGVLATVSTAWFAACWSPDIGWSVDARGLVERSLTIHRSARCSAGWPLPAFEANALVELAITDSDYRTKKDWMYGMSPALPVPQKLFGFETASDWWGRWSGRVLPLRPLFVGLVTDTLVFASVPFVLLTAPGWLRSRWRRRRGRCVDCGYRVRELERCPECGAVRWCSRR